MLPDEGQIIILLVAAGDPWTALGVSKNATRNDISIEHLKLCNRYKKYPNVIAALNKAKADIFKIKEDNKDKRLGG